jgi:hypothetical protein
MLKFLLTMKLRESFLNKAVASNFIIKKWSQTIFQNIQS